MADASIAGNPYGGGRHRLIHAFAQPGHGGPMPHYRRAWVPGGTYFFTVNLLERRRCLLTARNGALGGAFRTARAARPFSLPAWVGRPDHLPCNWENTGGRAATAPRLVN